MVAVTTAALLPGSEQFSNKKQALNLHRKRYPIRKPGVPRGSIAERWKLSRITTSLSVSVCWEREYKMLLLMIYLTSIHCHYARGTVSLILFISFSWLYLNGKFLVILSEAMPKRALIVKPSKLAWLDHRRFQVSPELWVRRSSFAVYSLISGNRDKHREEARLTFYKQQ